MINVLELELLLSYLRVQNVNWLRRIVQRGCLKNDDRHAGDARNKKQPQEKTIQHHGNKLPILDYLSNESPIKIAGGIQRDERLRCRSDPCSSSAAR